jgi:Glycosyl hydrolases family 35
LSVAELGTGYYSKFGGKLSEDEEGTDALQTNALTKTVIEAGVTYLNYYLGWGGTNFDWAAKGVTTTYDFAAPIREWGGLWDKYYTVGASVCFCNSSASR